MVTDPTRSIQHIDYDTALTENVDERLRQLASLSPSTDVPYFTLSIDWRIEGTNPGRGHQIDPDGDEEESSSNRRPARRILDQEMGTLLEEHGPRGPIFDSLSADAERIATYLDSELDPAAEGVFIVACSAKGIFEPIALSIPMPTQLSTGPTPALVEIVRAVDDHPTYAVLLADQHDATLSFFTFALLEQSVKLESTGYPRKQSQGGWSQRRYENRVEERIEAFARDVAEETRKALTDLNVKMLIVAGNEVMTTALESAFHSSVQDRVIATIPMDIRSSDLDVLNETLPLAAQAERERETAAVARMQDAIGEGGRGAGGPEATLEALQVGQVDTLLLNDDFTGNGWADYTLPAYGVGDVPTEHPLAGDTEAIVPIALEDEMVRLALETGATIEIVRSYVPVADADVRDLPEAHGEHPRSEASAGLDHYGGVGALLRYALDELAPPENI